MRFTERMGIKPVKNVIQTDSMDTDLRNGLWNLLTIYYWNGCENDLDSMYRDYIRHDSDFYHLFSIMWHAYFKVPIDTLPDEWTKIYKTIRDYFFSCSWGEVYDFIEFVPENFLRQYSDNKNKKFRSACNHILVKELSAYRFVGTQITHITSQEEISEIEQAMMTPLQPVNRHMNAALGHLADRKSPDYRNSIKESISAVEAMCQLVSGQPKATLGQALGKIESTTKVKLHQALRDAFSKMYGYTNDAEGIRHALLEEPSLEFEDAKFMLVSCSAFVNYLLAKMARAGIDLKTK